MNDPRWLLDQNEMKSKLSKYGMTHTVEDKFGNHFSGLIEEKHGIRHFEKCVTVPLALDYTSFRDTESTYK